MKVLMINGSPHEFGTTRRALDEIANTFSKEGVDFEIITVGDKEIVGCSACGACAKNHRCIKNGDNVVNKVIENIEGSDGVIVASPVYYASINGTLKCLLDRVFMAKQSFANKVSASVVVARRGGTTASIDIINKYFMISNMPIVSSTYWNMVHGSNGVQAEVDVEGLQTMRMLAKNMAWLMRCIKAGKDAGINPPEIEQKIKTNFVR